MPRLVAMTATRTQPRMRETKRAPVDHHAGPGEVARGAAHRGSAPPARGWAPAVDAAQPRRGDVRVDLRRRRGSAWPSSSWTTRRSAPPSSRCVANEWRRVCGEASLGQAGPDAGRWRRYRIPRAPSGPPRDG